MSDTHINRLYIDSLAEINMIQREYFYLEIAKLVVFTIIVLNWSLFLFEFTPRFILNKGKEKELSMQ